MGKERELNDYLKEVKRKVSLLIERNKMQENEECLIAFRGEARDYGLTKLMPSLFRDSTYVTKEKYLFELLSDYDVIHNEKKGNVEKAIEAQHYVAITRMLDITFNVLVAFYFACISEHDEDAKIYIFCFPEHYSPHSKYIEKFYTSILDGKKIAYSKNFKVISHSYLNNRIKAQMGGFIFFQGQEFSPISSVYYESIEIKAHDKKNMLKELDLLFGINNATIFPDKENRANLVKEKFNQFKSRARDLSIEDGIYTYFERIQYESNIYINKLGKDFDRIKYLRKLRKEREDLLNYIDINFKCGSENDEKNKWISYINDSFKIMENL